jgi:hypothetical protein
MPAANMTLQIVSGGTTFDFLDGVNNMLQDGGWSPSTSFLRKSRLGPIYEPMREKIKFNVFSTTQDAIFTSIDTLSDLLDQATRWTQNKNVAAVVLKYQPKGSNLSQPLQAIIRDNGGTNIINPASFNDLLMVNEVNGVEASLIRDGQWLAGPINDGTAVGNSGDVITCSISNTIGTSPPHSSLSLALGSWSTTNVATIYPGFLFVAGTTDGSEAGIKVLEADALGASGAFTVVNDSANNAHGTNVLRYTPTGTTFVRKTIGDVSWTSGRRLGIYATVRNNNTTTNYQIRAGYTKDPAASYSYVQTGIKNIPSTTSFPQVLFIGTLTVPNVQYGRLFIDIAASQAIGSLDIDEFVIIALDDDTSGVIGHDVMQLFTIWGSGVNVNMEVKQNDLVKPYPTFWIRQTTAQDGINITPSSDLRLRLGSGSIYTLWLTTSGARWRFSTAAGALQNFTVTPTHYNAYLTPR